MALVTCPDCRKEFSDAAPACPHCGRPNVELKQRAAREAQRKRELHRTYWLGGVVVAIGVLAALPRDKERAPTAQQAAASLESSRQLNARVACQMAIDRRLKAPSTAKYSSRDETTFAQVGDTLFLTGYVDAQNSFGAPLRSGYQCGVLTRGAEVTRVTSAELLK